MYPPSNRQAIIKRASKVAILFGLIAGLVALSTGVPFWAKLAMSGVLSLLIAMATDPDGIFSWFAGSDDDNDIYDSY
jgi:hypothetical protein